MHDDSNDPQVELSEAVRIVSEAIESKQVMQADQLQPLRRILMAEIDFLTSELAGKCMVTQNHYPRNLTVADFYGFIPLPTLVYELEYPRQDKINWMYVLEKTAATFGVIFVMIAISQAWIYPVVISALRMKDEGMDLRQRLREFPWVLGDLIFPFMLEYLLSFYVIWECVVRFPSSSSPFPYPHTIGIPDNTNHVETAECPSRTHPLCRPRLLRRLVELRLLGPVRAGLEPPRPQLPAASRLPQHHQHVPPVPPFGHAGHVLALGLRA